MASDNDQKKKFSGWIKADTTPKPDDEEIKLAPEGSDAAAAAALGGRRARLNQSAARLRSLGPLSILGRGYALVADENGSLLRDSAQTQKGRRLDIRLARGRLIGKVEEVVE